VWRLELNCCSSDEGALSTEDEGCGARSCCCDWVLLALLCCSYRLMKWLLLLLSLDGEV
jgi:hypothetical protein